MNTQYVSQGWSELDMLVMTPYGRNQEPQSLGHQLQLLPLNGNACVLSSVGVNILGIYRDTLKQGISSTSPVITTKHGFNPSFQTTNYSFGTGNFNISRIPVHNFQGL